MSNYLVSDTDLTSVANAIRTKGGTSAQLEFPSEFVSAIEAISGGGGYSALDILTGAAPAGDISITLTDDLPMGAVTARQAITKLTIDMDGHSFKQSGGNSNIFQRNTIPIYHIKRTASSAVNVYGYTFADNNTATNFSNFLIVMSGNGWGEISASGLRGNNALKTLDYTYHKNSSSSLGIRGNVFYGDSILNTLIIRGTDVMPLGDTNAFTNTPFASGKAGGTLYVPNSILSSYTSASNWSTILGYTNNQIKSIESTHTDPTAPFDMTLYYADGTPITA